MHALVWVVVLIAFVFLLTYDPKSCTLEKYITPKSKEKTAAVSTPKCDSERYQELQFSSSDKSACKGEPVERMGVIIR
jgi:hypothetical protein